MTNDLQRATMRAFAAIAGGVGCFCIFMGAAEGIFWLAAALALTWCLEGGRP